MILPLYVFIFGANLYITLKAVLKVRKYDLHVRNEQ